MSDWLISYPGNQQLGPISHSLLAYEASCEQVFSFTKLVGGVILALKLE